MASLPSETRHIFVYGSLRPDDDSGQTWTRDWVQGFDDRQPAWLPQARMFWDQYASVVLEGGDAAGGGAEPLRVHGWLLGFSSTSADHRQQFAAKLAVADQIEAFSPGPPVVSRLGYLRQAVDCICKSDGKVVRAWAYHRPACCRDRPIHSGDWLRRHEPAGSTNEPSAQSAAAAAAAPAEGIGGSEAMACAAHSLVTDSAAAESPVRPWRIFSFGSNSTKQLQRRVDNLALRSAPAVLLDHARCFCLRSPGWGGGGVASLCPSPGTLTRGAVVELTEHEKRLLDAFEGGYRLEPVRVTVHHPDSSQLVEAWAYIAGGRPTNERPHFTPAMRHEPSEMYLCAIHAMLAEHWPVESVAIRSFDPCTNTVEMLGEWRHPGARQLRELGSIVVEVSNRLAVPWEMPKTIDRVTRKLGAIGITTVDELAASLLPDHQPTLNQRLAQAGQAAFCSETLVILRGLLLVVKD